MKWLSILVLATAIALSGLAAVLFSAGRTDDESSPIAGAKIPVGYRQWEMVGVFHQAGNLDELRGILGNVLTMEAYRKGTLPFPDGAILVKLGWKHVPSVEVDGAFVPGTVTMSGLQIMVKDSKKYASTGGWGFGRFIDSKAADEAQGHDWVFTRYAP